MASSLCSPPQVRRSTELPTKAPETPSHQRLAPPTITSILRHDAARWQGRTILLAEDRTRSGLVCGSRAWRRDTGVVRGVRPWRFLLTSEGTAAEDLSGLLKAERRVVRHRQREDVLRSRGQALNRNILGADDPARDEERRVEADPRRGGLAGVLQDETWLRLRVLLTPFDQGRDVRRPPLIELLLAPCPTGLLLRGRTRGTARGDLLSSG